MEVKRVPGWDGTKEDTELYHHGTVRRIGIKGLPKNKKLIIKENQKLVKCIMMLCKKLKRSVRSNLCKYEEFQVGLLMML